MVKQLKTDNGIEYRHRSDAERDFVVWPYVSFQSNKGRDRKPLPLASLLVASAAFFIAVGFAASSRAASVAWPQAEATLAPTRIGSFTPAMVVGVGLWGALARRRRANTAGAPHVSTGSN